MRNISSMNGVNGNKVVRQSNFELLRVLAMMGIVIFHHFGNKSLCMMISLPENFTTESYFYDIVNNCTKSFDFRSLILDFCYGHFGDGGNFIFMLITGYFMFGRPMSLEKRVKPVLKIFSIIIYWGLVLTLIHGLVIRFLYPFAGVTAYKPVFNLPNWLSGSNMWYFQAYGIFVLVVLPILKLFEDKIDQKTHRLLIIMLVSLLFLDFQNYLPNIWLSLRILEFVVCYYIGGYISRYSIDIPLRRLVMLLMAYVMIYLAYEYYWRMGMRKMYAPSDYSYIKVMSPLVCTLTYAVLVFLIFSKLSFRSGVINHISQATPGIYVFHYKIIALCYVIANTYWWRDWSISGYCAFVLIDSAVLFVLGYMGDVLRQKLFEACMSKKG